MTHTTPDVLELEMTEAVPMQWFRIIANLTAWESMYGTNSRTEALWRSVHENDLPMAKTQMFYLQESQHDQCIRVNEPAGPPPPF